MKVAYTNNRRCTHSSRFSQLEFTSAINMILRYWQVRYVHVLRCVSIYARQCYSYATLSSKYMQANIRHTYTEMRGRVHYHGWFFSFETKSEWSIHGNSEKTGLRVATCNPPYLPSCRHSFAFRSSLLLVKLLLYASHMHAHIFTLYLHIRLIYCPLINICIYDANI